MGWGPSSRRRAAEPGRIGNFLTALMNEMRVLGVTTLYTLEVPDIMGPAIRSPIGDLSSLAENLILLRFVEVRSRLYRLVSLLKVRDSDFDPTLHEYVNQQSGADHRGNVRERRADHDRLTFAKGRVSQATSRQPQDRGGAASDGNRARGRG